MAKTTITRTLLRDLPPPPEGVAKVRIFDDRIPGFIAERRRTGTTFYLRYSDHRGRGREVRLGRLGDITADQARRQAEQLRASVSLGADPVAERARRRAVPLFADFARDRYLPHVKERLRSAANPEAQLRLRIVPFLGRKALDEVTQDDVAALRRRLLAEGLSGATVNRHLATVRSMFNLALKWQLHEGRNPAASPGMLAGQHRERFLTAAETQALVRALDAEPYRDAASALALLILTGARKQEALRGDVGHGRFRPRRAHRAAVEERPAPARAAVVVRRAGAAGAGAPPPARQLPRLPQPAQAGSPLEGLRGPWERAKAAAGLPADLRIHDLRHSLASALANAGTPLYEIGAVLGHRQLSTTLRYSHYAPQRLVQTATAAALAWNLPQGPEVGGDR